MSDNIPQALSVTQALVDGLQLGVDAFIEESDTDGRSIGEWIGRLIIFQQQQLDHVETAVARLETMFLDMQKASGVEVETPTLKISHYRED